VAKIRALAALGRLHLRGADHAGLEAAFSGSGADRDLRLTLGAHLRLSVRREINRPRQARKYVGALSDKPGVKTLRLDLHAARKHDEADLSRLGRQREACARRQLARGETNVSPACALRGDVMQNALGGFAGGNEQFGHGRPPRSS